MFKFETLNQIKFGINFDELFIMKKLLLLFVLFSKTALFSQTVLNSLPLNLNFLGKTQILNAQDEKSKDIYVFTWDNKNVNILKYNPSLFLANQFTDSIKPETSRDLIGYSISENKKPSLYWSSHNYKNILITVYNLDNKTSESLNFDFPKNHDYIISSFQQNNIFYILAKEKDFEHLLLYKFEDGKCVVKMFDFSSFIFKNERNTQISFNALIKYFPIQKVDPDIYTPIELASSASKMYVIQDHIILTFDNTLIQTQAFDLNIKTGEIKEKTFDLPAPETPLRTTNSFYSDNKLFQVKANKEFFLFQIKDFDSGKGIKNYSFSKNDTIPFMNSPFIMQIDNNEPRQLKTTEKFLKSINGLPAGVSVFKNHKNSFITFSGFGEYSDFYFSFNSSTDSGERVPYSLSKAVYFDAMLSENLSFAKDYQSRPLAIDNLFYFLNSNKGIKLYDALRLKDFYVLSYFDSGSQQFVMRKFTDGPMMQDNGNPIINKSQFSKPFSFGDIK
ncbi:hypothetical protein SAMN05216297_10161 [Flavobacterium phragmitis]|uniref:Uncharacterized protein n=2 Tax=Flavobacterium phragmitis TaxID=739143 RepID=A0A1I1JVU7_9FLAO|nr:hypothetical protein SAMN05216297_10161 [Flavobacterium phragmitis]